MKNYGEFLADQMMQEFTRQSWILGMTTTNLRRFRRQMEAIVNGSFHNATFSQRLWNQQDALKGELDRLLTRALIQGLNPRTVAPELKKKFDSSEQAADLLMITELCRVQTEAQKLAFQEFSYEDYTFICNGGACKECEALNGKHFKVKDMQAGRNASPMYPRCRCSTAAYMDREAFNKWLEGQSKATQESGRSTLSQEEIQRKKEAWKQMHSTSNDVQTREVQKKQQEHNWSVAENLFIDPKLKKEIVNGFEEAAQRVFERFGRKLNIKGIAPVLKSNSRHHQASYDPTTALLRLKNSSLAQYKKNAEKYYESGWNASNDEYGTFFHEIGHAVWTDLSQDARSQIKKIFTDLRHSAYLQWMDMGGSRSGKSQAEIFGKSISRYALENEEDFFSEAFSQIMSGRMRPVSRQVNRILYSHYREDISQNMPEPLSRDYINQSGQVRYFAKEHKRRKVPKDDPLWDSLVQGDVEKQLEEGIFEWQHGGYEYLVEIKTVMSILTLARKNAKTFMSRKT